MSFSGGVYTLPGPALATGEVVSATENNQFRNDVATAFNLTFLRNGTSTATANLPMGGYKLTGLGVATTSGDALSYGAAAVVTTLTSTSLTATRVPYAGTGGLLQDASTFTFNGTTLTAGGFTTSGAITVSGGTANGVAYLNGSKVLTTGSALVFDGSNLGLGVTPSAWGYYKGLQVGYGSLASTSGNDTVVFSNAYYDSTNYKYLASSYASQYRQVNGAHVWLTAPSGTAGNAITFTQAMTLDASGNLGIGTSSPGGYKLNVSGTSVPGYFNSTNGNSNVLAIASSGTVGGYVGASGSNLIITPSSGNNAVLINKTTAADAVNNKLEVSGWGYFKHPTGDTVLDVDSATTPTLRLRVGGTARASMYFSSSLLYLGTTASSGDWYITRAGANVAVVGAGGVTNISDARLKSNIQPASVGLNEISKLSAKTYERNGAEELGLIAQEIEAAGIPFVVTEHDNGDGNGGTIKAVNGFGMIAALVNAVNELKAELDATKTRLTAAEEQILNLGIKPVVQEPAA